MTSHPTETPRRILAVNLNYLGDALFTTPALSLLRERLPFASVDVLAGERAVAILSGVSGVDRLLTRPPRGGVGRAASLHRALTETPYDAILLFQSILSNAAVAWAARVPRRVGFAQDACAPFLTDSVAPRAPGEHVVEAYLRLAAALAEGVLPQNPPHLSIAVGAQEEAFARNFFHTHELLPPVVGLVVGATRPQKRWPEEYFARLAEKLWKTTGVASVLLGGPEEAEAAARIAALSRAPLISAVGQTTAKELAALTARLGVVVSGDSGPLHIAVAMRTPVVALFGSTDPAETGPWSPDKTDVKATILYDALACAPCRKSPTCGERYDCLRALGPERVFDAVCAQLGAVSRRTLPMAVSPAAAGGGR